MSIAYMAHVRRLRGLHPTRKLVLLLLADNANEDGECWPRQELLAEDVGIGERALRDHLAGLVDDGLVVVVRRGKKRSNLYRLTLSGHPQQPADTGSPLPVTASSNTGSPLPDTPTDTGSPLPPDTGSPLPVHRNPQVEPPGNENHQVAPGRPRDWLWEAAVEWFGEPANTTERSRLNGAVGKLREANVEPDELERLVAAYVLKFPEASVTAHAVAGRVGELRHFVAKGHLLQVPRDRAQMRNAARQQARRRFQ